MSNEAIKLRFDPVLLLVVCVVTLFGAYTHAGSWNDGSRLAAVQSLVDFHTWQIDDSNYTPGLGDKLFINGHFYSDKAPVPILAMAAVYQVIQWATDLKASEHPAFFYYIMTVVFTGSAYVISVWCVDLLAAFADLPTLTRRMLAWSFAFGTLTFAYSRVVNNHLWFMAILGLLFLIVAECYQSDLKTIKLHQLLAIGSLLGIGYTIEMAMGPLLVIGTVALLGFRTRNIRKIVIVLAAAFPWFVFHHILNYRISGTFIPAESVAKYYYWPGSPLAGLDGNVASTSSSISGAGWVHSSIWDFLNYGIKLWIGADKGFLLHNLTLFMALPAAFIVWRKKIDRSGLVQLSLGLIFGAWLLYAATSINYAGICLSVRWLVPLLLPFYYILIVFLKSQPAARTIFHIVAVWSVVLGIVMWQHGPWSNPLGWPVWGIDLSALLSVVIYWLYRWKAKSVQSTSS